MKMEKLIQPQRSDGEKQTLYILNIGVGGGSQSGSEDNPSVNSLPVALVHAHTHKRTRSGGAPTVFCFCAVISSLLSRGEEKTPRWANTLTADAINSAKVCIEALCYGRNSSARFRLSVTQTSCCGLLLSRRACLASRRFLNPPLQE